MAIVEMGLTGRILRTRERIVMVLTVVTALMSRIVMRWSQAETLFLLAAQLGVTWRRERRLLLINC
jgi:hypothetical protein